MIEGFQPLLAENIVVEKVKFPVYVSPKLDGIRCVIIDGKALTRKLKPIPNNFIRTTLESMGRMVEGLDGELIVGYPNDKDVFNRTSSAVMSRDGEPNFKFYVFDRVGGGTYRDRWVERSCYAAGDPRIEMVPQRIVFGAVQLAEYETKWVNKGFEGVMVRDPDGKYKFGRSTVKEGILLKIKRFADIEAEIIGFEERMHNANEAVLDERGYTKRSTKKDNMVPTGTLGALICKHPDYSDSFGAQGFDNDTAKEIWDSQEKYLGKLAKIRIQKAGEKDKPRFPVFLGIRDELDM